MGTDQQERGEPRRPDQMIDLVTDRLGEQALRALIETGNPKAAGHLLGISRWTVRRRVRAYCAARDLTIEQAAYLLDRVAAQTGRRIRPNRPVVLDRVAAQTGRRIRPK